MINVEKFRNYSFIILAGGKSSRMGFPKHKLIHEGKTFAEILACISQDLGFGETIFSGLAPDDLPDYIIEDEGTPARFVADELPDRGPLGGLHACLKNAQYKAAFVVPVDCPFLTQKLVAELILAHENGSACVTLTKMGAKTEPLIGVYDKAVHEEIFAVIEHKSAPVFRVLDKTTYAEFIYAGDARAIANINTRDDYKSFV